MCPPELPPQHLQWSRSCVPQLCHPCPQCRPIAGKVRKVTELSTIFCTFWFYSVFIPLSVSQSSELSAFLPGGRSPGPGHRWAVSVPSPPCLRTGWRVWQLPCQPLVFGSVFFFFWGQSSCRKGRKVRPQGLVIAGSRRQTGRSPVHPLITLMLHLLFTFVLLYIGL